jgi:hypothetical protein
MGGLNFFRPRLIRRSGSHKEMSGRKSRWGCCLDYLFHAPTPRSSLKYFYPSLVAKVFLSAMIREVIAVSRDRARTESADGTQSADTVVDGWRRGRVTKVPRCSSSTTRLVASLT